MVEGRGFIDVKNINEALIALHNYMQIWRYEYPLCYGPQALFRTVFEHYVAGKVTSANLIIDFCNNILEQNAVRASRNEVPLDYDKCHKREQRV